jgi:drug/metabolite transporter (DMT)-like permease
MAFFKSLATDAGANTPTILALRFLIAGVGLWLLVSIRPAILPRGRTLGVLVLMGAVCYFLEAVCYFHGLEFASSATIALLLYTYPAMVAIASRVLFGEQLGPRRWLALALATAGTGITISGELSGSAAGIALGLACAAGYAIYILAGARLLPKDTDPLASSAVVVTSAAASLSIYATIMGWALPNSSSGWLGIVALAIVCTVLAITAILAGVARVGAVRASTISTVEPLATVLIGAMLLGETLGLPQILGGGLIIAGAIIAARAGASASSPHHTAEPTS